MKKLSEYFKPTSFTWWAGLASIAYGLVAQDINAICTGLVGIGLRRAVSVVESK